MELKALFFKTLYRGVAAFDFNTSGFHIFLDLFFFFLHRCLLYTSCVLGLRLCVL